MSLATSIIVDEYEWSNRQTALAYFAGFFDGEGCVSIVGSSLAARISNTYLPILELFKDYFGGAVGICRSTHDARQGYQWSIYGKRAEDMLTLLLPHLIEKAPQARLGILYREFPKGDQRAAIEKSISLLKRVHYMPTRSANRKEAA